MQKLQQYLAVIQNKDRDLFDNALDKISHQSGIRAGSRLSSIIPMTEKTVYEVALSVEEAVMLALACPGEYKIYQEISINDAISEYMEEVSR